MSDSKHRCFGSLPGKEFYADYHDHEWGVPVYNDKRLFELLILEGAQAGLSWETILKRREGYRNAFYHFDPMKVSVMTDLELETLLSNPNIIRNRLKIYATRKKRFRFPTNSERIRHIFRLRLGICSRKAHCNAKRLPS